jgi:calcineurin-binding protein cabin-1
VQFGVQVALLVTLHDILAEYGLCCAGKDSEGGEGAFLKMNIKHLGALESRLKPQTTNKSSIKTCIDEPLEKEIVIDDDVMIIEKPSSRPVEANEVASKEKSVSGSKDFILLDEESQEAEAEAIEKKRVELGIDYALDQSFFCLYGLNLRGEATGSEGLVEHQNTNRGDYKTMEQCAGVLQYILPYAKACSV